MFETRKSISEVTKSQNQMCISGKTCDLGSILNELIHIGIFSDLTAQNDTVHGTIVEKSDNNGNRILFIKIIFSKNRVIAEFNSPEKLINPYWRDLQVGKIFFSIVSILESKEVFLPNRSELYSGMASLMESALKLTNENTLGLKYELDRLSIENEKMNNANSHLNEENDAFSLQLIEQQRKIEYLESRIKYLERMPDSELDREILNWVETHGGTLNDAKFCKNKCIHAARLEERLVVLSKKGVIQVVDS